MFFFEKKNQKTFAYALTSTRNFPRRAQHS
jgi:hypothetical protein